MFLGFESPVVERLTNLPDEVAVTVNFIAGEILYLNRLGNFYLELFFSNVFLCNRFKDVSDVSLLIVLNGYVHVPVLRKGLDSLYRGTQWRPGSIARVFVLTHFVVVLSVPFVVCFLCLIVIISLSKVSSHLITECRWNTPFEILNVVKNVLPFFRVCSRH